MGDRVPFYAVLRMLAAAVGLASSLTLAQAAPFMIVGNDEKLLWDDQFKPVLSLPGRDSVLIVDLADPMNPKIVANLPLKNSVVGPPQPRHRSLRLDRAGRRLHQCDQGRRELEAGARGQSPRHRP
jgi:hypothetical protein